MKPGNLQDQPGFTLIEILLVVAVVAILVSLAMPGYRQFISRSHRVDAIAHLMRVASCQERLRAQFGVYDTGQCLPAGPPRYELAYAVDTGSGFTVLAHPRGAQTGDPCGTLILRDDGDRQVSADGANASRCWSGR